MKIEQQNKNGTTHTEKVESYEIDIKKSSYKDFLYAYVKSLFYSNKKWIKYLEVHHIKKEDVVKFTKLVSSKTKQARQNYFEGNKKKLNPLLRRFIDKYNRWETHSELYGEK